MKRRSHEKFCTKDPDGRCRACQESLVAQTRRFTEVFQEIEKKMDDVLGSGSSICSRCYDQEIDAAIALLGRELSLKMSIDYAEIIMNSMRDGIIRIGRVKQFPLTDKAIRDLRSSGNGKRS